GSQLVRARIALIRGLLRELVTDPPQRLLDVIHGDWPPSPGRLLQEFCTRIDRCGDTHVNKPLEQSVVRARRQLSVIGRPYPEDRTLLGREHHSPLVEAYDHEAEPERNLGQRVAEFPIVHRPSKELRILRLPPGLGIDLEAPLQKGTDRPAISSRQHASLRFARV